MKFGLLAHGNSGNVGDHIQSLAARQFLPRVDCIVERERMHEAADAGPLKLIMNGWWMKDPERWPPPPNIHPLFVSFHVTTGPARAAMLTEHSVAYLRRHEPIGCRDLDTMAFLRGAGIAAYFSGCLTMTFPRRPREKEGDVLFVDAFRGHFFETLPAVQRDRAKAIRAPRGADGDGNVGGIPDHRLLARIAGMPEDWCSAAREVSAMISRDTCHETKFDLAASLLERFARARIIVTSRLHTLLPATAMGVPCLFVLKDEPAPGEDTGILSDKGHDCTRRDPRLSGLIEHVHHVTWSRLLDGLPAGQWGELAAESPCHDAEVVAALSARVRGFIES